MKNDELTYDRFSLKYTKRPPLIQKTFNKKPKKKKI